MASQRIFKDTFQQNFKSPYYSSLFTSFLHTLLFPCLWGSSFDFRCDVIGRLLDSRRRSAVYFMWEKKGIGLIFRIVWFDDMNVSLKIVSFWANLLGYLTIYIKSTTACVPSLELVLSHPLSRQRVHCIKSELYLAKWKWILRSGPKLKMLVKFHRSNGSFPNPLNWWRIRFDCTAIDQCYWNKENWFANWKSTMHFSPPPQHKIDKQFWAHREIRPHVTGLQCCASDHWTTPALIYEMSRRD